jgi:hypothetical protein
VDLHQGLRDPQVTLSHTLRTTGLALAHLLTSDTYSLVSLSTREEVRGSGL